MYSHFVMTGSLARGPDRPTGRSALRSSPPEQDPVTVSCAT